MYSVSTCSFCRFPPSPKGHTDSTLDRHLEPPFLFSGRTCKSPVSPGLGAGGGGGGGAGGGAGAGAGAGADVGAGAGAGGCAGGCVSSYAGSGAGAGAGAGHEGACHLYGHAVALLSSALLKGSYHWDQQGNVLGLDQPEPQCTMYSQDQ